MAIIYGGWGESRTLSVYIWGVGLGSLEFYQFSQKMEALFFLETFYTVYPTFVKTLLTMPFSSVSSCEPA